MNEFTVRLDLAKGKARQQQTVFVRQGDKNATTIVATITDHGAAAATSGLTARFQMRLPNGTEYYRKAASLSGNVATVALDEAQAASVAGRTDVAYFQLLQGSTVVASTESFTVVVLPDALADAEVAESYDSAIQDAIDALDAAVEQMPDMVEDVLADHPEWTTTVQDGSVSDAKLYQGTDGILARVGRLQYRLANMLTNTLPEGDVATASDAAQTPMAGLALYGRSTQDGTPTPSAPVPIVSVSGANLLDDGAPSKVTSRGVTVTPESGGWFRVSGTSTGTSAGVTTIWGSSDLDLPAGTYTAVVETEGTPFVASMLRLQVYASSALAYISDASTYALNATSAITRIGIHFAAGSAGTSVDGRFRIAVYAGSTAYPYVPYGNVGLRARGRNLFVGISASDSRNGLDKAYESSTNTLTISGTSTASNNDLPVVLTYPIQVPEGARLILSLSGTVSAGDKSRFIVFVRNQNGYGEYHGMDSNNTITFTEQGGKVVKEIMFRSNTYTGAININAHVQLEFGSTATAYQPYEQTVTPIDLDGHELRSLPDGTRDELTVGADGHAVLVQRVQLTTQAVTDGVTGTVGVDVMSSTGAIANGATVLYKLATPVTHDLGYVAAVPLVGPDLTAQAVPTAPFALTYERDLNTTLARLESAIATLV